jgi:hypothetical protein
VSGISTHAVYRFTPSILKDDSNPYLPVYHRDKGTGYLWSVVAIQRLTGCATILMGNYYRIDHVFILYGILAVT